jgi:hypothetical protein
VLLLRHSRRFSERKSDIVGSSLVTPQRRCTLDRKMDWFSFSAGAEFSRELAGVRLQKAADGVALELT